MCDVNWADEESCALNVTHVLFVVIIHILHWEFSLAIALICPYQHQNFSLDQQIYKSFSSECFQMLLVPPVHASLTCETRR